MVEPAAVGEAEALVVSPVADGPATFEAAFDQVFAAAYRAAFRLLGEREEASDCAQEALTRAYPRWERLQRKGDPSPWVVRVAANLAIDRWRRQQRSDRARPTAEATHVDDESVVTRAVLNAALAELPKRQREVVVLRYVGDFSEAQVASALGISPGAVKQQRATGPRRAARPVGGQLMDLTHLDDVQPPVPDAAMRGHVVKTARRRRRTHVGLESATAMLVVAAIILAGVGSTRDSQRQVHVAITNPPSTTSTVAPSTTVAPNTVTVQLVLDHTSVAQGQAATGTVVFTNTTGHDVVYTSKAGCLSIYAVVVGASLPASAGTPSARTRRVRIGKQQPRRSGGPLDLAAGVTRVSFTAPSDLLGMRAAREPEPRRRAAMPGERRAPPLPSGRSYVWFLVDPDAIRHTRCIPAPGADHDQVTVTSRR